MEQTANAIQKERQRKFLLVLPILVLPFITLLFWSLGGGTGNADDGTSGANGSKLSELPWSKLQDENGDKLEFYDQADRDSAKRMEQLKNDPNYKSSYEDSLENSDTSSFDGISEADYAQMNSFHKKRYSFDTKEEKIYRKLDDLQLAMNNPGTGISNQNRNVSNQNNSESFITSADIDRLQQTMMQMQSSGAQNGTTDPEMNQLNTMLDKVLDIQHPDRLKDRIQKESALKKGVVFSVVPVEKSIQNTVLKPGEKRNTENGFYSIEDDKTTEVKNNAVPAIIYGTQTLTSGSTVKMELENDIYINGTLIPGNSFVFGLANLEGERLVIKVNSVRFKNSIFPISLNVFDIDGVEGIYIPGAITRDVSKESADRALQGINISAIDPSLTAQAASAAATAGVETVKTLLSKKVKLIKATVKAGYRILLVDEKQKTGE